MMRIMMMLMWMEVEVVGKAPVVVVVGVLAG